MASKEVLKINFTKGKEISIPCVACTTKTAHKVLGSADIRGDDDFHGGSISWEVDHQIIQCLGCKAISFRRASWTSEDFIQVGPDEYELDVDESLYPSRLEGREGLGDETIHLPSNVRGIYRETLLALNSQAPILSGIGMRALLETVCKEKKASGKNLLAQIDNLVTKGVLTPVGASILHKIRALGNAAAHEVKPHAEKQLSLAMDIVEHLLKDVYILPKQAETEFKD
jgi:hypothetical protein